MEVSDAEGSQDELSRNDGIIKLRERRVTTAVFYFIFIFIFLKREV